jgi:DNA polymerase delta subunit 1
MKDPVIQIANIVKVHGDSEPIIRNVFTLKSCAQIVGTKVYSFEKETDLLNAWRDFIQEVDPDFITGYNTQNFDFPYIIDRANFLQINNFAKLGRLINTISKVRDQTSNIKALGMRESKDTNIEGRVQLDMMQVVIRDHKLRSYSLNSVSFHFLNEQKEDVPHSIISDL